MAATPPQTTATRPEATSSALAAAGVVMPGAMPAMTLPAAPEGSTDTPSQILAKKLIGDPKRLSHLIGKRKGAAQILDLDALRKALGGSWPAYGELVHRIAVRVLMRHLGGAYEFERYADRYVVAFQDLSEPIARERISRIANALAEFLFGTGTNAPEPMAGRGRYEFHERGLIAGLADDIGAGIGSAFGRLFRTVGTLMMVRERSEEREAKRDGAHAKKPNVTLRGGAMDVTAAPARTTEPKDAAPLAPGQNKTLRGAAPLQDAKTAAGKSAGVDPGWSASSKPQQRRGVMNPNAVVSQSPLAKPRGAAAAAASAPAGEPPSGKPAAAGAASGPLLDGAAQSAAMQELAKRAAQRQLKTDVAQGKPALAAKPASAPKPAEAPAPAVAKPAKPTELAVDQLSFVYRSMWSVRTSKLAISGCYVAGKLTNGELAIGDAVLPPAAALEVIEKVDRAALDHVIAHCLPVMESGRGALIALPVHYETLFDRERRNNYLNICKTMSPAARKRLIFECRNLESEVDQSALISNLQQLKPYATMIIGMLPLRTSNFALWKRAGLGSVGVDVGAAAGSESEIIDGLHQFAHQASQAGLRATACNLGTLSLAAAALQAGFDFIEGGVIQNQLRPTDVRAFTLEDLYLQYAVARRAKVGPDKLLDGAAAGTPA